MMYNSFRILIYFLLMVFTHSIMAQSNTSKDGIWKGIEESRILLKGERQILPQAYRTFALQTETLKTLLASAPREQAVKIKDSKYIISIPMPNGHFAQFRFVESSVMAPELAAKYPELKTFAGQGITDPQATIRFDYTAKGFHAQILSPKGAIYVDPYSSGDLKHYISYYKKDLNRSEEPPMECEVVGKDKPEERLPKGKKKKRKKKR